jgi:hypothetical protein
VTGNALKRLGHGFHAAQAGRKCGGLHSSCREGDAPSKQVRDAREERVTTREKRMPGTLDVVGVLHVSVQGSRAAR